MIATFGIRHTVTVYGNLRTNAKIPTGPVSTAAHDDVASRDILGMEPEFIFFSNFKGQFIVLQIIATTK
mgnify:CR=1 FL=1